MREKQLSNQKVNTAQRSSAERECCGWVRRQEQPTRTLACLQVRVNGGAEKNQDLALPETLYNPLTCSSKKSIFIFYLLLSPSYFQRSPYYSLLQRIHRFLHPASEHLVFPDQFIIDFPYRQFLDPFSVLLPVERPLASFFCVIFGWTHIKS
jgi:hypothetical protein